MITLINVIAFKIGWLASVLGAANGLPILGPLAVALAIVVHLRNVEKASAELQLILFSGLAGAVCDSVLVATGWLTYPSGTLISGLAPYWIVAMWMLFATTFNVTFRRLQSNLALAAVLGAIFGPLSFYFGAKTGAVTINNPPAAFLALSVVWAVMFPSLLALAERLHSGTEPVAAPS